VQIRALFPRLPLVEDWFCLYEKRVHSGREKNRLLSDYLRRLDMSEFGDAIKPDRPRDRGRNRQARLAAGQRRTAP